MTDVFSFLPHWAWIVLAMSLLLAVALIPKLRGKKRREVLLLETNCGVYYPVFWVSYAELKGKYERSLDDWQVKDSKINSRLCKLNSQGYEVMGVPEVLSHASTEERGNLTTILGVNVSTDPLVFADALRKAGSNGLVSLFRGGYVPYEEVVKDVAKKLGAKKMPKSGSAFELERHAIGAAVKKILDKASPDERKAMLAEFGKTSPGWVPAGTAALVLANLSGFGLYMAASSTLAAVTSAVGVTLPFAAYTGMSSLLATLTGPLGWGALLFAGVIKLFGEDYKKTIPGVLAVASARARLIASRDDEISKLNKQRNLQSEARCRLEVLAKFLFGMEQHGTNHYVPKASVPWLPQAN